MVPKIAGKGKSFHGALAYYLHDKRQEGETERRTAERVAWAETMNLCTDDPQLAKLIMIDTAKAQAQLKASAGIKATGRKSSDTVLAYSLAWHADEAATLTKAEMLRAVRESLRTLGAEGHQAVIVAHRDTPHPHVHVILNRVNPKDGRMLSSSNDQLKLSQWAEAYEKERGKILCAERVKNNAERRQKAYVRAEKPLPRSDVERLKRSAANDNARINAARFRETQRERDAALSAAGRAMHARHRKDWAELSAASKARWQAIKAEGDRKAKEAIAAVREAYKAKWRDLYRQNVIAQRRFQARETRLSGILANVVIAAAHQKDRQFLKAAFNFLASKPRREAAFKAMQERARADLAGRQRDDIRAALQAVRAGQKRQNDARRAAETEARGRLTGRQRLERAEQRIAWRRRNEERKKEFEQWAVKRSAADHGEKIGKARAAMESRHTDQQIRLERSQDRRRDRVRAEMQDAYGPARERMERRAAELRSQIERGGVSGRLAKMTGGAWRARVELADIRASLKDAERREQEWLNRAEQGFARETADLRKAQETERRAFEQRVSRHDWHPQDERSEQAERTAAERASEQGQEAGRTQGGGGGRHRSQRYGQGGEG